MHLTKITFPLLHLRARDGHKLRGYFAEKFGEESDLFHNHDAEGKAIYRYPRIQYKVIQGMPMILGIEEGSQLLVERFLQLKVVDIEGVRMPLEQKNLNSCEVMVGVREALFNYQFLNPWMAVNQRNYEEFINMPEIEQQRKLQTILISNMIAFFKAIGHQERQRILVNVQVQQTTQTYFKDKRMLAFRGRFTTNVELPDHIGFGKATARGFGAIEQIL